MRLSRSRGSDPLRLVRVRLALVILAAAVLPMALGLVVVPALDRADAGREQARVAAASEALSAAVAAEVERVGNAILMTAANGAVVDAARGATVSPEDRRLAGLAAVTGTSVEHVAVYGTDGRERIHAIEGVASAPERASAIRALPMPMRDVLRLAAGEVIRSDAYDGRDGIRRMVLATPVVDGTGSSIGIVAFEIPLVRLLTTAPTDTPEGGYAQLVDATSGEIVADSRATSGDPADAPATGLQRLDRAVLGALHRAEAVVATLFSDGWSVGLSPLSASSLLSDDWALVVAQPAGTLPLHLLVPLAALIGVLIVLLIWMSRQVMRPAGDLERSRIELRRLYERAKVDALTDPLTALGNHRAWQEESARQTELSRRHGTPTALVLIDLDDFKRVNDATGHATADELLRGFGALMAGSIRATDRAFRVGGDEFAIVMPQADAASGLILAQRLLDAALRPDAASPLARSLSFSAGVAATPLVAPEAGELFAAADAALFWAKRHGRSAVEVYDPARHRPQHASAGAAVVDRVGDVITRRALRPVFQPIIDVITGRVLGYEGLVRPTADAGFTDPGSLFAAAAACDRVVELDMACFEVVGAGAAAIEPDRLVSINLSPRTLEGPDFKARRLADVLAAHGITTDRVILELTEREVVEDMEQLRSSMEACRAIGFKLAADDVGAGNAGLRLLSQLDFDIVKVDLSLVQGGAMRDSSLAVLRSLIDLAGRWGAMVVAEGVETPEQFQVVRDLGAKAAQGYLLGRPAEALAEGPVDVEQILSRVAPSPRQARFAPAPVRDIGGA
ncbi:MAG TPA: EAL domain-containing protein [Candidatus Limnocylindrales bacterium]